MMIATWKKNPKYESDDNVHQFICKDEAHDLMGSEDSEVDAAQNDAVRPS